MLFLLRHQRVVKRIHSSIHYSTNIFQASGILIGAWNTQMIKMKILACLRVYIPVGVSVQFSSVAQLCLTVTPWIAACQASLSITISQSSNSCPSSRWCHPTISSSVVPFSSCPQSLPAWESFPMSQLFAWGGQSAGVSALASLLPKKSQGWSPSEWTGWISLQSKGLSRVFSSTTVQKHQFFSTLPSSQSNSHIHILPQEKP